MKIETLRHRLVMAEEQGASAHARRPTAESAMELDTIRWVLGLIDALPADETIATLARERDEARAELATLRVHRDFGALRTVAALEVTRG